jgi:hypothetical protein
MFIFLSFRLYVSDGKGVGAVAVAGAASICLPEAGSAILVVTLWETSSKFGAVLSD